MHSTNSYLYTLLERIRAYLDEPSLDAKYTGDYIIRHIICPVQMDVLSRLWLTQGSPVILTYDITVEDDVDHYVLPPCVQQVLRLVVVDTDGVPISDVIPRSIFHQSGSGWAIEGTPGALMLRIEGSDPRAETLQIWYVSNGDILPHYGTGTLADVSGTDRVTLTASPTLGALDRRPNAYAGQVLRILSASPAPIEERPITTSYYSGGSWYAEVRRPFVHTSDGSVTYEIAPAGSQALYEAIAAASAIKLGVGRKISQRHRDELNLQYRAALKTIGDSLTNMQGRLPHHFDRNTVDNPNAIEPGWIPLS